MKEVRPKLETGDACWQVAGIAIIISNYPKKFKKEIPIRVRDIGGKVRNIGV